MSRAAVQRHRQDRSHPRGSRAAGQRRRASQGDASQGKAAAQGKVTQGHGNGRATQSDDDRA